MAFAGDRRTFVDFIPFEQFVAVTRLGLDSGVNSVEGCRHFPAAYPAEAHADLETHLRIIFEAINSFHKVSRKKTRINLT